MREDKIRKMTARIKKREEDASKMAEKQANQDTERK
jgi:hypothetical protein